MNHRFHQTQQRAQQRQRMIWQQSRIKDEKQQPAPPPVKQPVE